MIHFDSMLSYQNRIYEMSLVKQENRHKMNLQFFAEKKEDEGDEKDFLKSSSPPSSL